MEELFRNLKEIPGDSLLRDWIEGVSETSAIVNEPISPEVSRAIFMSLKRRFESRADVIAQRNRWVSLSSYAAVAAVFVGVLISGFLYFATHQEEAHYIEIHSAFGQIKTVTLPDESKVILNGNSSLRYPGIWNAGEDRQVHLNGEAYFSVVHQVDNRKFKVFTSNDVVIEVLGTEFNVNDRRNTTKVVLETGQIRLNINVASLDDDQILMRSGEYVEVDKKTESVTRKLVDTEIYTSWQEHYVIFKDTSLKEILQLLEDNYGITSLVNDTTLLQEKFTATYPSTDSRILIKALEKSFMIKFDGRQNAVIVGAENTTQ
jgi:ferric-dicitrate binding protein FerR (iron transport regulator)